MKHVKRRYAWIALPLSVCAGLALAEVATRLFLPYSTPETLREYSLEYVESPFGRFRLAPAGRLVDVDPDKAWGTKPPDAESERSFFINDLGFRGPGFAARKPTGVTRVFVMGGSAAFDQNVSDLPDAEPRSWPNRAQAALRPHGHTRVEVINGGVPGHGSIDVIARLQSEIWLYQPDVVVLYNAWNDIKYFRAFEISPDDPPYSVLRTYDPSADPFRSYRNGMDRILARSQIYMKLRNRYFSTRLDAGAEGIRPEGEVGSGYGRFGPEQYELNIRSFVDIVRNMGAVPVLATQAALVSPDNDEEQRARMGYDYQLLDHPSLVAAFEDTYRIVRSVAVEESVPLLDAAAAMNGRSEYFTDHVHLSDEGSRVLAELLADRLTSVLELERGGNAAR